MEKTGLVLGGVLLALLLLEISCRYDERKLFFTANVYVQHAKPQLHRQSEVPGLSYELVPGAVTENGFYRINSRGLRDRDYAIPKPSGVYRIIVLGDSVTFGTEYPVAQTYPKLLEQSLQAALPPGRVEVLNAGVCGYNAVQKYIFLKTSLLAYQPDLVVFQFLNDDYRRNAVVFPDNKNMRNERMYVGCGEYFENEFPSISGLPPIIDRTLMRGSALYRWVNKRWYDRASTVDPERFPPGAYRFAAFGMNDAMAVNKRVFEKISRLSARYGFDVVLLLVPELSNDDSMDPWIRDECPQLFGFGMIDLFSVLRNRGVDLAGLRIIPEGRCHFNRSGHVLTAQVLFDWVKDHRGERKNLVLEPGKLRDENL
ncbi:MAG: hypothetical protein PHO30_05235 [Candidatus Omnitrophica bacterium]|nr:hypothetical protein [Candidatus Omnitrophota bacterium]